MERGGERCEDWHFDQAFVREWISAWNSGRLEEVLQHYADEVIFESPFAARLTGECVVRGKDALRAYWAEGLRRAAVHFTLQDTIVDAGSRAVAVLYHASVGGLRLNACEVLRFGPDRLIHAAAAYYSAAP